MGNNMVKDFGEKSKTRQDFEDELLQELKDSRENELVRLETSPAKMLKYSKEHRGENKETEETEEMRLFKSRNNLEKKFYSYIKHFSDDIIAQANLYRHLKSSQENITNMISAVETNQKIDVSAYRYKRLEFEKFLLKICHRINKYKNNDESKFTAEKNHTLLILYRFRENNLIPEIIKLKKFLIEKKINLNLESPKEHIFVQNNTIRIDAIIEKSKDTTESEESKWDWPDNPLTDDDSRGVKQFI